MYKFQLNRYVNASYEWPILEQFIGKCCRIISCPDWPSELGLFNKYLQTTQRKTNLNQQQKTHANQLIPGKF